MSDNHDESDDEQHEHAHAIASVLQEALEDYLAEQPPGEVGPLTLAVGIQILGQGWTRFLGRRGWSASAMVACTLQGSVCAEKLVDHLEASGSDFVPELEPEPEEVEEQPKWIMQGPVEEC